MAGKTVKNAYRYLLYLFVVLLKKIIACLLRKAALRLGRLGGRVSYLLLKKEREKTLKHLKMVYGCKKARILAPRVFASLGMNLIEWMRMPVLFRDYKDDLFEISGLERINDALSKGKGVIIVTAHLGNWEYLAAFFALRGYRGAVVGRKIYYANYDRLLVGLRNSVGVDTIYRNGSVRDMVRVLRENGLLGILPDQDTDKVDGIFVNFLGYSAYTPTGPVSLAMATGASIIPCFIIREGYRHHVYVEKPLNLAVAGNKNEDIAKNTKAWSGIVERFIQNYPEQWVWMHKRWKTKVEDTIKS